MKKISVLVSLLSLSFFVYSFAIERNIIKYPEVNVYFNNLPDEFDGFRIAVISDTHYGPLVPEWWLKNAFDHVMALQPDAIAGVGDYVRAGRRQERLTHIWGLLNTLKAKEGVYLVNGNHDAWENRALSMKLLKESGNSVRHTPKSIRRGTSRIIICGVGDFYEDGYMLDESLRGTTDGDFKIILAHNPDSADLAHRSRVDLYLCGHTHGGQIRIPFIEYSPLLPVKNKNYDSGLKENRLGEKIFISKGVGWSIVPLRFNVYPEIPIIVLRKK